MTPLRQRMIEDMQLRGLSENTQASYVRAVRQFADHYNKSPAQISDEELRQYFLYLKNEKRVSRSTSTIALCAIKFLSEYTLGRAWPTLALVRPPSEKKLPVILSREEVQRFLGCIRNPRHQVCLSTIYACGLRRNEALRLQVGDIDGERMVVHVRKGKWSKDRYIPLPQPTLTQLRTWWAMHRNPVWLFPTGGQAVRATATKPMSALGLYRVIEAVRQECKIEKAITIHTFRHAYATHLYEDGVNLRLIQKYLGHASLSTTAKYLHETSMPEGHVIASISETLEAVSWSI